MNNIQKEFLVGKWKNDEWSFELTMFNYLKIRWEQGGKAYGAWVIRNNEVIFTFNYLGDENKQIYVFSIREVITENKIRVIEIETNKEEILERVIS